MTRELLALTAGAVLATGCATGSPAMSSNTDPLPPVSERTTVLVQNHNWSDMVVYAVRGNHRVRLGMVTSMNTSRLVLPKGFGVSSWDVQFLLSPIGSSETYLTEPIMVSPGQTVELRLENTLSISNWAVW